MKNVTIGGPGSRPTQPVEWPVKPAHPEPSAVDFLAAIEDPGGASAIRVMLWKTQQMRLEIDKLEIERLRTADFTIENL